MATVLRVAEEQGVDFGAKNARRSKRMRSKNVSAKAKKQMVSGTPAAKSRGGGFWGSVGHWFTHAGDTITKGVTKFADGMEHDIMHIGDKAADVTKTAVAPGGAVTAAVGPGGAVGQIGAAAASNPAIMAGAGWFTTSPTPEERRAERAAEREAARVAAMSDDELYALAKKKVAPTARVAKAATDPKWPGYTTNIYGQTGYAGPLYKPHHTKNVPM